MIEEVTMHEVVCDGCGKTSYQHLHPDDEPPKGFLGTVTDHTTNGRTERYFACRRRCLGPAANAAVERAHKRLHAQGELPL